MYRAFANYGRIVEVVIPAKRDRLGQRFGFARFDGVDDPNMFGTKLDNIIIGATKLNVNAPRFARSNADDGGKVKQIQQRTAAGKNVVHKNGGQHLAWRVKRDVVHNNAQTKSYAEAVKEKEKKKPMEEGGRTPTSEAAKHTGVNNNNREFVAKPKWRRRRRGCQPSKEEFKGLLCYEVEEEEIAKFHRKYIGYVKQAGTTYSVQEWFSRQGVFSVKATPLGANSVLLEDIEEGTLDEMMNNYQDWLLEKFEDIKPWQPFVVDNERLVWVRCHGIPPHAWGEGICKLMANTLGNYVDIDEDTRKKRSMDIARMVIRTRGLDVINTTMHVTINGSVFPIRIMEEWCGPLRLCSTTKGSGGIDDDAADKHESEESDCDYDMEQPLFSPEKTTEPASPPEVEGETAQFNEVVGRGDINDSGEGEDTHMVVANDEDVGEKLQNSRNVNEVEGRNILTWLNDENEKSGGRWGVQK